MKSIPVRRRAIAALGAALERVKGKGVFERKLEWYVREIADNLVPGVPMDAIISQLGGGAGRELAKKIRAAYSSSALAVNAFGPWLSRPGELILANVGGFSQLNFEVRCPTGLTGDSTPS